MKSRAFKMMMQIIQVTHLFADDAALIFVEIVTDRDHGEEQGDQDHQGEE